MRKIKWNRNTNRNVVKMRAARWKIGHEKTRRHTKNGFNELRRKSATNLCSQLALPAKVIPGLTYRDLVCSLWISFPFSRNERGGRVNRLTSEFIYPHFSSPTQPAFFAFSLVAFCDPNFLLCMFYSVQFASLVLAVSHCIFWSS